jgi:hypothetical protein
MVAALRNIRATYLRADMRVADVFSRISQDLADATHRPSPGRSPAPVTTRLSGGGH